MCSRNPLNRSPDRNVASGETGGAARSPCHRCAVATVFGVEFARGGPSAANIVLPRPRTSSRPGVQSDDVGPRGAAGFEGVAGPKPTTEIEKSCRRAPDPTGRKRAGQHQSKTPSSPGNASPVEDPRRKQAARGHEPSLPTLKALHHPGAGPARAEGPRAEAARSVEESTDRPPPAAFGVVPARRSRPVSSLTPTTFGQRNPPVVRPRTGNARSSWPRSARQARSPRTGWARSADFRPSP